MCLRTLYVRRVSISFEIWKGRSQDPETFKLTSENYESLEGYTIRNVLCIEGYKGPGDQDPPSFSYTFVLERPKAK